MKELLWVKRQQSVPTLKGLHLRRSDEIADLMPQSLSAVYIHLVFSIKHRQPFLRDIDLRQNLHPFLEGTSKKPDCPTIIVGGVEDHIHLARHGRTITQADWVKELKRVSNIWLKKEGGLTEFEWQGDYANFSDS
jgi:hypothetical protein